MGERQKTRGTPDAQRVTSANDVEARLRVVPPPLRQLTRSTASSPGRGASFGSAERGSQVLRRQTEASGKATIERKRIGSSTSSTGPWAPSPSICSESPGLSR